VTSVAVVTCNFQCVYTAMFCPWPWEGAELSRRGCGSSWSSTGTKDRTDRPWRHLRADPGQAFPTHGRGSGLSPFNSAPCLVDGECSGLGVGTGGPVCRAGKFAFSSVAGKRKGFQSMEGPNIFSWAFMKAIPAG
jgi:hypothetical protein